MTAWDRSSHSPAPIALPPLVGRMAWMRLVLIGVLARATSLRPVIRAVLAETSSPPLLVFGILARATSLAPVPKVPAGLAGARSLLLAPFGVCAGANPQRLAVLPTPAAPSPRRLVLVRVLAAAGFCVAVGATPIARGQQPSV